MKVLEHCIYKDANDTRRCEVTMAYGDDELFHVREERGELMDLEREAMSYAFDDLGTAWAYLDEQFKQFRKAGFRYIGLPLEEVAA